MTFETYEELNQKGLEPRRYFVTMANGARSKFMGVVEDVRVTIDETIF